jgi:hypothetical protein
MIWLEDEHQVLKVTRFDPLTGKTGKGTLFFLAVEGGHRALDVEDIIAINAAPLLKKGHTRRSTKTKKKK